MAFFLLGALTSVQSQTLYFISNGGNISTCEGLFFDSGGATGNYSNGENSTYTICSSTPGAAISVEFTSFDVDNSDVLNVYDSNGSLIGGFSNLNSAAGIEFTDTINNCLTFEFISGSSITASGWQATIKCIYPCQPILPFITSSSPPLNPGNNNEINLCQGDTLHIEASAVFPTNNTFYNQSFTNCTFGWDIGGDGSTDVYGLTFDTIFPGEQGYLLQLDVVDSNGCSNSVLFQIQARISTTPTFAGLSIQKDSICFFETNKIFLDSVVMNDWQQSYGNVIADSITLPDGSGISYSSKVTLEIFSPGQILTDTNDLTDICLNLEHSFLGELKIEITCPTGQSMVLLDFPNSGGGTFLGEPVAGGTSATGIAGIGYDYCFTPNPPNYGTFEDEALKHQHIYTDLAGNVHSGINNQGVYYLPPGDYRPHDSFASLLGCELNGDWEITITDHQPLDDGNLFSWVIDFDSSIFPIQLWGYQLSALSNGWVADSSIISTSGETITVLPSLSDSLVSYTYTVTDNFGCTYDTTLTFYAKPITDPSCKVCFEPKMDSIPALCFGESTGAAIAIRRDTLNLSPPPYEFIWTDNAFNVLEIDTVDLLDTLFNLSSGTYHIILTDSEGCSDTAQVMITEPTAINALETSNIAALCKGDCSGSSSVSSQGGTSPYSYLWPDGNPTATTSGLCAGLNTITITDANLCIDSFTVSITEPLPIVVSPLGDDTICYNTEATKYVEATGGNGGYTTLWDTGSNNDSIFVTLTNATSYSVVVVDMFGCSGDTVANIFVRDPLKIDLPIRDTICNGDSAILLAMASGGDGNYNYIWANGLGNSSSISVSPIDNEPYTVTLSDNCGSPPVTADINVLVGQYPTFSILPPSTSKGCSPQQVQFYVDSIKSGRKYIWDFGDGYKITENSPKVSHLYTEPGCYDFNLTVETVYGCASDTTSLCAIEIFANPEASFDLTNYNLDNITSTTTFIDNSTLANSWQWDFGDGETSNEQNVQHTFQDTGLHIVTLAVENFNECKDTATLNLDIGFQSVIYAPNTFTPNGDGKNDVFNPLGQGVGITDYLLSIYDRWGQVIFSTTDVSEGWDGYIKGKLSVESTYVYKVEFLEFGQTEVSEIIGHVTLLRIP